MSYGAGSTARDAAERERNVPIVLRYFARGNATRAQMADDLAARCGSMRAVEKALQYATEPKQGFVHVVSGKSPTTVYGITDAGRATIEQRAA